MTTLQSLQKWIEEITMDRDASLAHLMVRRIPAVTAEMAEALKAMAHEGRSIVSKRSARNRNMAAPATLVAE